MERCLSRSKVQLKKLCFMEDLLLENLTGLLQVLEKKAYALAKGFEGQYNKGTTSPRDAEILAQSDR